MDKPLVSVICLCCNHGEYVADAIRSVLGQTYEHIELIVVDDASVDGSREAIEKLSNIHGFRSVFNDKNLGNCISFNKGFAAAKGKYIIDLAADDVLLSDRIEKGVQLMEQYGARYGVHFCDVELMTETGESLGTHYRRDKHGKLAETVPDGAVFSDLLERYFICTPSMMMAKKVLDELGGYDEELTYEDFDFWIRSSRNYKYIFSDEVLVQKRLVPGSLSAKQKLKKNPHSLSTARVCEKALHLIKNEREKRALLRRIRHELKWALITENREAAELFLNIKRALGVRAYRMLPERLLLRIKLPCYGLVKLLYR